MFLPLKINTFYYALFISTIIHFNIIFIYIIYTFLDILFFDRARQFQVANPKCFKLLTSVKIKLTFNNEIKLLFHHFVLYWHYEMVYSFTSLGSVLASTRKCMKIFMLFQLSAFILNSMEHAKAWTISWTMKIRQFILWTFSAIETSITTAFYIQLVLLCEGLAT